MPATAGRCHSICGRTFAALPAAFTPQLTLTPQSYWDR
jgi:hypothetical protein